MNRGKSPYVASVLVISLVLFGLGQAVQATPLNLILESYPDVCSGFIDVTYDSGSNVFDATGWAFTFDDDGSTPAENIANGSFNLNATIDATGLLGSGTLTIGGTIASLGYNSGNLLTGSLTGLGFIAAGGDPLEFVFDVEITGGDLASYYAGKTGGVILGGTSFPGSFANDFDNNSGMPGCGQAVSDTGVVVPEPATISLLIIGLVGAKLRRRSLS